MAVETAKISARGQVVIPKAIRDALGATEDSTLTFIDLGAGHVLVQKLDSERIHKEVEEFWQTRARSKKVSSAEIEQAIRDVRAEARKGSTRH